ncbi:MAG: hypothetical protein WA624_21195 [Methylocella sp.]
MKNEIQDPGKRASLGLCFSVSVGTWLVTHDLYSSFVGGLGAQAFWRWRDAVATAGRLNRERQERGIELLFGNAEKKSGVPSIDNPFSGKPGITKPTSDAVRCVIHTLQNDEDKITKVTDLKADKLIGSFIFFGGPVANAYSRHILGLGGPSPLLSMIHSDERAVLPMHFDLPASINSGATVDYTTADYSTDVRRRPAWELVVEGRRGHVTISNGRQEDDFLVLTSIPNVYSPSAFHKHRITIVSGAHGPGTRAIDLVLADPAILDKILTQVKSFSGSGWQALINVSNIDSQGWPRKIEVNKVKEIIADFDKLHDQLKAKPFMTNPSAPRFRDKPPAQV